RSNTHWLRTSSSTPAAVAVAVRGELLITMWSSCVVPLRNRAFSSRSRCNSSSFFSPFSSEKSTGAALGRDSLRAVPSGSSPDFELLLWLRLVLPSAGGDTPDTTEGLNPDGRGGGGGGTVGGVGLGS